MNYFGVMLLISGGIIVVGGGRARSLLAFGLAVSAIGAILLVIGGASSS